jgi:hypothetical protein
MAVNLTHRQQWVNFPGRPITTSFTLHGPLANDKMGLGISLLKRTNWKTKSKPSILKLCLQT